MPERFSERIDVSFVDGIYFHFFTIFGRVGSMCQVLMSEPGWSACVFVVSDNFRVLTLRLWISAALYDL